MFINKDIHALQYYHPLKRKVLFEPDSSPDAWEHYKQFYSAQMEDDTYIKDEYDFDSTFFYTPYKEAGLDHGYYCEGEQRWLNYTHIPKKDPQKDNRLYALKRETQIVYDGSVAYCEPADRMGGECDFNFKDDEKESKYRLFKNIIETSQDEQERQTALIQLEKCKKMHHTLLNFSLMQAMGNMQKAKGRNRFDRLDTFIYKLNRYLLGVSEEILNCATDQCKQSLIMFLEKYSNIYEYCKEMYFIEDSAFVDEIIQQGTLPIRSCKDVIRYMNLAEQFWERKENYFLKTEFLTICEYYKHGGETYTFDELMDRLVMDLSCTREDGEYLINKCIERGFIIDAGHGIYTR